MNSKTICESGTFTAFQFQGVAVGWSETLENRKYPSDVNIERPLSGERHYLNRTEKETGGTVLHILILSEFGKYRKNLKFHRRPFERYT